MDKFIATQTRHNDRNTDSEDATTRSRSSSPHSSRIRERSPGRAAAPVQTSERTLSHEDSYIRSMTHRHLASTDPAAEVRRMTPTQVAEFQAATIIQRISTKRGTCSTPSPRAGSRTVPVRRLGPRLENVAATHRAVLAARRRHRDLVSRRAGIERRLEIGVAVFPL